MKKIRKKVLKKPTKKIIKNAVSLYAMEGGLNYGNCNCTAGC